MGGSGSGAPRDAHGAAKGLAYGVVGSPIQIVGMTGLTVSGHVDNNDTGISGQDRRVIQAPLGICAGLRAFHPDVGAGYQVEEQLPTLGCSEIQGGIEGVAPVLGPQRANRETVHIFNGNTRPRVTSPMPGRSIRITSAPISAALAAEMCWATMVPVERMRTPCSGPNCSGSRDSALGSIVVTPLLLYESCLMAAVNSWA